MSASSFSYTVGLRHARRAFSGQGTKKKHFTVVAPEGEDNTYLVKVLAAPFGSMFPRMPIKYGKVPLSLDTRKVIDKAVSILHRTAASLIPILSHADTE